MGRAQSVCGLDLAGGPDLVPRVHMAGLNLAVQEG